MGRVSFAISLVIGAVTIVSCSGGSDSSGPNRSTGPLAATGDFTITVTAGLTPTFSWPGGNATGVLVSASPASGTPNWLLSPTAFSGFASPVVFGIAPVGGQNGYPTTKPLIARTRYIVSVQRVDARYATQEFIP